MILPVAIEPLWQDTQVPVTKLWSTFWTGVQLVKLVWQASQALPDLMCAADLPVASLVSWQEKQLPVIFAAT